MAQRLSITIPDDVHRQIQDIKDQINVSAICAEALRIEAYIRGHKGGSSIERLRAERDALNRESEQQWFQAGRIEGAEAAENTSYKEFKLLSEAVEENSSNQYLAHWSEPLWECDDFEWIVEVAGDQEVPESHRPDFYRGIFEALLDWWYEVKDEVMA